MLLLFTVRSSRQDRTALVDEGNTIEARDGLAVKPYLSNFNARAHLTLSFTENVIWEGEKLMNLI